MSTEEASLKQLAKSVVKEAVLELIDERLLAFQSDENARTLAEINSKPFITLGEAAILLGCSVSHLSKQIKLARQKKTKQPIPFLQIGDAKVYALPREEFLAWARPRALSLVQDAA